MAIVLKTISDSKDAQADLAKLKESVGNIESSAKRVSETFSNFTKVLASSAGLIAGVVGLTRMSDAVTNLESKLKVATDSQLEFNIALRETREIAISSRTDLNSITNLYSKLNRSAKGFGASQSEVSLATSLISKSIATSGASLQESNAAVQQLGQALASGKLAGDELRSILENAPPLAGAIADGLGVSIGKLRELGEQGVLSSAKVFKAILSQQKQIESSFAKVDITFGQAFQNLRTSLFVLASESKRAVLGATGGLANAINNAAKGIFDFASTLGLTFALAKLKLFLFVADVEIGFAEIKRYLFKVSDEIYVFAQNLYNDWQPIIQALINDLLLWSKIALASSIAVGKSLYDSFSKTNIGKYLIDNIEYAIGKISVLVNSAFSYLKEKLPKIDILKIFPGLQKSLEIVKNWAIKVEGWFAWLYNKIIGNSWIPDLVIKTTEWLSELLGKPLTSVISFVNKSNDIFSKFGGGLLKNIISISKAAILAATASVLAIQFIVKPLLNKTGFGESDGFKFTTPLERIVEATKPIFKKLTDRYEDLFIKLKEIFSNFKNIFNFENKVSDLLPSSLKLGLIAALTGVFAFAIVSATQAGIVRTALTTLLSLGAGVVAYKTVPKADIYEVGFSIGFAFLSVIERGITGIFSGSVLNDPTKLFATLLKLGLLFEQGRKVIGNAALQIASAPTRAAQSASSALEGALLRRDIRKTDTELAKLPTNLNSVLRTNKNALNATVARLSTLTDSSGNAIGNAGARAAIASGNLNTFGTAASRAEIARGAAQQEAVNAARSNLSQINNLRTELTESRARSAEREEGIRKRLEEQRAQLRQGTINAAAGAGGILGGVAGFQIGTEVARGMTDSPAWVKVGTAVAISFVGQAIGAGIGALIAQGILAALGAGITFVGTLLASPIVLAGLAIAAAIAAVMNWESLVKVFDKVKKELPEFISKSFNTFIDFWNKKAEPALKTFITDFEKAIKNAFDSALQSFMQARVKAAELPVATTPEQAAGAQSAKSFGEIAAENFIKYIVNNIPGLTPLSPQRKSTGGGVFGPGTGKSDSIPAMLSNGEFVVNAKDAKANWGLLTAINSGFKPVGFADGTAKTETGVVQEIYQKVTGVINKVFTKVESSPVFNRPKLNPRGSTSGSTGTETENSIESLVGSVKTIDAGLQRTADLLKTAGFDQVANTGVIKEFALLKPGQFSKVSKALDEIGRANATLSSPDVSEITKARIREQTAIVAREISSLVSGSNLGRPGKNIQEAVADEDKKPTKINLGDQFRQVQEAFPELGLTLEEFNKIKIPQRTGLLKNALNITSELRKISSIEIGTVEGGLTATTAQIEELVRKQNEIEKRRLEQIPTLRASLKQFRTPFADFELDLKDLGLSISREAFNSLDGIDLSIIEGLKNQLKSVTTSLKDPKLLEDPRRRQALEALSKTLNKQITQVLTDSQTKQGNPFEQFKTRFEKSGVQIDEAVFNLLTPIEKAFLDGAAKQIQENKARIATLQNQSFLDPDGALVNTLQADIFSVIKKIQEVLNKKSPSYKTKAMLTGEALASETGEALNSGLSEVLKGKLKPSQFVKNMANSFSSSVVNSFTKGLLDPLTSENGILQKLLKSLGSSLFSMGGSSGTAAATGSAGIIARMFGFGRSSTPSIDAELGFATGGYVSGPGTGTSDSIAARLSDGEYVVKASAVKGNIDLLNSINSGRFSKFAEGGLVSTSMADTPNISNPDNSSNAVKTSNQQVVNINITGDISRQTKAEIYQMLPSIAEGVNSHNRERGFRG